MDILLVSFYAVCALIGFGLVIAIHEFGHFIMAKWAGVRVDRFAIGFGPVVLRRQVGETEYALCLLPFGGYVAMLGQTDGPEDQPADPRAPLDPRSYLAVSAWWRAGILLGGVAANLISSVLLLLGLAFAGMPVVPAVVGDVVQMVAGPGGTPIPSPAAQLGLRQGDRITTMDGKPVRMFDDLHIGTLMRTGQPVSLTVQRDGQELVLPPPGAPPVLVAFDRIKGGGTLGIAPAAGNRIQQAAGAEAGGPRPGDRVLAVAGRSTAGLTGQQIAAMLAPHAGRTVTVSLARDGETPRDATITYAGQFPSDLDGARAGLPVRISGVAEDSPNRGLLLPGDLIVGLEGAPVAGVQHLLHRVRRGLDADAALSLTVWRDGEVREVTATGAWSAGVRRLGLQLSEITTGHLPVLPAGLDGGPSALAGAGVAVGDVLISLEPLPNRPALAVAWATPAATVRLPVDDAVAAALLRADRPGLLARIGHAVSGGSPAPPMIRRLALGQVRERPAGLAATTVPLTDDLGAPVDIDLAGTGCDAVAGLLAPGDRVVALVPGPDGPALEVARGIGRVHHAVLELPRMGTTLATEIEAVPYQLRHAGEAFVLVADAAHVMIVKTVQMIPRFFRSAESGGVDATRTLSGPVGIFRSLWNQLEFMGFDSYLRLLAFIGLNLVLVNLLPIPITDGGQLLFLGIEQATGRPVTGWIRNLAAMAGLVLVVALMLFTLGLDILRWTGLL
jgi:RIP metalloprotease RseP